MLQDVEQILKNAETCRPRSDLGWHCFADLNFDGFRGLGLPLMTVLDYHIRQILDADMQFVLEINRSIFRAI